MLVPLSDVQNVPADFVLPQAIEFNLQHNAEHPLFTYVPLGASEMATITHLEFGRAVHRAAHIFRPNREGNYGYVVAVIALVDTPLYHVITAGLMMAGLVVSVTLRLRSRVSLMHPQPLLISPRNSAAAIINLLQKTSSHRLLATEATLKTLLNQVRSLATSISPTFDILIEEVPAIADVYPKLSQETAADPFHPYPAAVKRPLLDDVCAYLHSSGSTGLPRPIAQTHRMFLQCGRVSCFSEQGLNC
jgi:acyl-CoA synthetase (AMP-forming)/AMP-acid ligase II